MNRVQNTKTVLWTILGLAAAVGLTRFIMGLGATTNLTDATPWGFWIGFDVMAGVALAGGGFVMTAIFYIFKQEKYHDLVKPAVLTAFLGYLAVIFGLLFDLGLPWNIWHMMIHWNLHSPLFEVGWCVMLYTTVLLLEFSPVPLEEASRYAKIRALLMKVRFPLVMLGIMLSTLHQSSLGSLFLIMPHKLHALWYTPIMPVLFFISAAALGLGMVSFESLASHWLYRKKSEHTLVAGLGKAALWVLSAYFLLKMGEIAYVGEFGLIFEGTRQSNLFIIEILMSAVIPIIIFAIPKTRNSVAGQWIGSFLIVAGMVFNRINVGGLAMNADGGLAYIPSWMELTVSLGVVSVAGLAFLFAIEHFHIWDHRPKHPESNPHETPSFDYASNVWLGSPFTAARTRYTLVFVLAFAFGLALMPESKIEGKGVEMITVEKARGGDVQFIDGNHDTFGTMFKHAFHIDTLGRTESCVKCHHMNKPLDKESGCWECHRGMYAETDVFRHDWHASADGGNLSCGDCHQEGVERQASTAKVCKDCHTDLYPAGNTVVVDDFMAESYVDAMHKQCIECHETKVKADSTYARLTLCTNCHTEAPLDHMVGGIDFELARRASDGRVTLPKQILGNNGETKEQ